MFGNEITISEALIISVVAITIVFIILLLIALAITSFKYIFKEDVSTTAFSKVIVKDEKIKNVFDITKIVKEEEIVALIVATIESNIDCEDKKYKIVSFREV